MQITYLSIRKGQQLCIRILDLYILYVKLKPGQSIWLIAFRGCERWSSQSAVSLVAKSLETSGRPTLDCSRQVTVDNVWTYRGSTIMFSAESFHSIINIVKQAEYQEGDALDALQLKRYCCRRMLLGHVVRSLKIFTTRWKPGPTTRLSFSGSDWKAPELRPTGKVNWMVHTYFFLSRWGVHAALMSDRGVKLFFAGVVFCLVARDIGVVVMLSKREDTPLEKLKSWFSEK